MDGTFKFQLNGIYRAWDIELKILHFTSVMVEV